MTIAWQVDTHAKLPSTQDYLRDLNTEGAPEGTVVQALSQTAGRGRQGRTWVSPMGNLYISVLLRPECRADKAGQMSFVAAVAVSAAMDQVMEEGHSKVLKWPNDILIDGKKAAGILIETSLKHPLPAGEREGVRGDSVRDGLSPPHPTLSPAGRGPMIIDALIVGIGINILASPEDAIGLGSLSGGKPVPIHPFRDKVLAELDQAYHQWKHQGFAPIRTRWLKQAYRLREEITVRTGQAQITGTFENIDKNGGLLFNSGGATHTITAAEILS